MPARFLASSTHCMEAGPAWLSVPMRLPRSLQAQKERELPAPLTSAFGWKECAPEHVHRPVSTEEVSQLVGVLYKDKLATGRDYLLRASHEGFYTHNNFSCADAGGTSAVPVVIDMSLMDRVMMMDKEVGLVSVQAGITFEVRPCTPAARMHGEWINMCNQRHARTTATYLPSICHDDGKGSICRESTGLPLQPLLCRQHRASYASEMGTCSFFST